ncbi:helix-turn-helix domain-containing protein [uncultured Bacteroides sp.]|uniref:helix-turn-helix domain-containing protein n=1 Tax=uncultured Bacteroides sp. TaxID=162156 RepID=UPI0025F1E16E|nr:helix-turn-helix domain-containing protein [uncultured Bacteroides sp.]
MDKTKINSKPPLNDTFDLEEFNIYTKVSDLPLTETPAYLEEGINGICTGGSALFNVFYNKRKVTKNDLVTIFPYQLASITEISNDFSIVFFKVPKKLFLDTIRGVYRPTLDYFFYMRKYYSFPMCEEECKRFIHFCHILTFRADIPCNFFRRESIMSLLRVFYWDIYVGYKNNPKATQSIKYTRKEKLVFDFFCLIIEYHSVSRDVAFYAEKMCISPKYLTMLVTDNTGRSAKEWIVEYTIIEIKALLRDSNFEIKEIVSQTNFQSSSTMTRFFREHTGITPSEYRKNIII